MVGAIICSIDLPRQGSRKYGDKDEPDGSDGQQSPAEFAAQNVPL
jgi:hypothetical protein